MCLSLVTTESPEKQDALSAEFLISLISFFSDTSLVKGLITDYRVASGAKWMDKVHSKHLSVQLTGAQTVEAHHMISQQFQLDPVWIARAVTPVSVI